MATYDRGEHVEVLSVTDKTLVEAVDLVFAPVGTGRRRVSMVHYVPEVEILPEQEDLLCRRLEVALRVLQKLS